MQKEASSLLLQSLVRLSLRHLRGEVVAGKGVGGGGAQRARGSPGIWGAAGPGARRWREEAGAAGSGGGLSKRSECARALVGR